MSNSVIAEIMNANLDELDNLESHCKEAIYDYNIYLTTIKERREVLRKQR